MDEDQIALR